MPVFLPSTHKKTGRIKILFSQKNAGTRRAPAGKLQPPAGHAASRAAVRPFSGRQPGKRPCPPSCTAPRDGAFCRFCRRFLPLRRPLCRTAVPFGCSGSFCGPSLPPGPGPNKSAAPAVRAAHNRWWMRGAWSSSMPPLRAATFHGIQVGVDHLVSIPAALAGGGSPLFAGAGRCGCFNPSSARHSGRRRPRSRRSSPAPGAWSSAALPAPQPAPTGRSGQSRSDA